MNSTTRLRLALAASAALLPALVLSAAPSHGETKPVPLPLPSPGVSLPPLPEPKPGSDPTPKPTGTEAWEKGRPPVVVVQLPKPWGKTIHVYVQTVDGTAVAPEDYEAIKGMWVTIPAGSLSVEIPLTLVNDGVKEPDEYFLLKITKARGATIDPKQNTAVVTIRDGSQP